MNPLCLHVLPTLDYSGALSQARLLAAGLPGRGFDVHIAALQPGDAATELARGGVEATLLGRRWRYDPLAVLALRRLIRRLRPALVHAWGCAAAAYAAAARPPAGIARVVSPKDAAAGTARLASYVDRVVVSTAGGREALAARGLADERVAVVPYGAAEPPAADGPDLRAELELPDDATLVAAVGPFSRHRDAKTLVWGIDILGVLFPALHLVAVGGGPALQRAIRFRNAFRRWEQVHFLGPRDDLPRLWHQFAACWAPEPQARHGTRLLEAMAAGVPLVAADTPARRELIGHGDTGFLFPPGARTEMTRWTRKLLEDPALAGRMADAARERAQEGFSAEAMVARMAEVYGELIG